MAGLKRCIGVDVGGHSVKIVEMAADKKGVRISRMVSAPVEAEPNASDEERAEAATAAVRGLLKTHKISTKHAVFCMPGQTVIVRPLRLPRAPGPRLHQIINFEARQIVPFPLDKTMLQYQVFDTEEEREVEVLLVAMKKEANQEFMRSVRRMGLRPVGVGISTLALFNGQELRHFNAKEWLGGGKEDKAKKKAEAKAEKAMAAKAKKDDKKKKKKKGKGDAEEAEAELLPEEETPEPDLSEDLDVPDDMSDLLDLDVDAGFEEVRAYVNFGARSTDLAVCKAGGAQAVGFVRPIPIGGNHISAAIYKECGCKTFAEAEEIKRERTAALSGQFEFEGDKAAFDEKACAAATAVCDRIIAELRRSLDYFISQPDGVAVDLLVLSGGGAHLAYLASYVEERLGIPTEVDSGLGHEQFSLPEDLAEDFDFAPYKIAIGLAAQGLEIASLEVNFLPAEIQAMRGAGALMVEVAALAALIGGMVFFGSQVGEAGRRDMQNKIDEISAEIAPLEGPKFRYDIAANAKKGIAGNFSYIQQHLGTRDFCLRVLSDIKRRKPADVLITRMDCWPNYQNPIEAKVTIQGEATEVGFIGLFQERLEKEAEEGAPSYIKSVGVDYNSAITLSQFSQQNVFSFTFNVVVQEDGSLPATRLLTPAKEAEFKALQPDPAFSGEGMYPGAPFSR